MKLHVTAFDGRIFISVDSPFKDRKECLEKISMVSSWTKPHCTNFQIDLTIEPLTSRTTRRSAHVEGVVLEERLFCTDKRSKCRLCGIQSTEAELEYASALDLTLA